MGLFIVYGLRDVLEKKTKKHPQAQSGEWRRAMFVLCTLALAGTEDQLIQAKGNREVWDGLTWSGRLELRVSICRACACACARYYGETFAVEMGHLHG